MPSGKTVTVAIMDAPYESPNSTTALRIINAALQKGHNVNVFTYERGKAQVWYYSSDSPK